MARSTLSNQATNVKTDPFLESVTYVSKTQRRVLERREIVFQCLNENLLPKIEAREIMEKVNKGLGKSISHTVIYQDLRAYRQLFIVLNKKDGVNRVGKERIEPAIRYFLQDWKEGEKEVIVKKINKEDNFTRKKLNLIADLLREVREEMRQVSKKLKKIERMMESRNVNKIGFSIPRNRQGITEPQQAQ